MALSLPSPLGSRVHAESIAKLDFLSVSSRFRNAERKGRSMGTSAFPFTLAKSIPLSSLFAARRSRSAGDACTRASGPAASRIVPRGHRDEYIECTTATRGQGRIALLRRRESHAIFPVNFPLHARHRSTGAYKLESTLRETRGILWRKKFEAGFER